MGEKDGRPGTQRRIYALGGDQRRQQRRCFQAHLNGTLPSGAHYFAISDNTYNIFDIDTPKREVGYDPVHNAESFYD